MTREDAIIKFMDSLKGTSAEQAVALFKFCDELEEIGELRGIKWATERLMAPPRTSVPTVRPYDPVHEVRALLGRMECPVILG